MGGGKNSVSSSSSDGDDVITDVVLNPYHGPPPSCDALSSRNSLEKNMMVDGVFGEKVEKDMDGNESFSISLLNGKPQIKISPEMLDELRLPWKNSLIVTLFGKTIDFDTLCSKIQALWNLQSEFKALDLGENYFLFTFESIEDLIYVYTEGPWVVMDHFLSVRKWEPNFKPSEAQKNLKSALWVRFRELPVEFFNDKIIYIVAKSLGRPIKVDRSAQGNFARVCIEIDLSKPLCLVIEIEGKDCVVDYESILSFCFDCTCSGHIKTINCDGETTSEKAALETKKIEGGSMPMRDDGMNKVKTKEIEKENDNLSVLQNGGNQGDNTSDSTIDHPGSDFNDFLFTYCFEVGQVWAVYDRLDSMPRVYAQINNIISKSRFKMCITWLERYTDDEDESKWIDADLPVSWGNFRKGNTETIENYLMFSHKVDCEKGTKKDTYKIYPRKGEVWALFKNWDMNWYSNYESETKYEFEFAEILSDYNENSGLSIAYLAKVKGFSCVFCRIACEGVKLFQIPPNKLYTLSNRVPCFRLSGEENVPKNCFELDPAALPSNIDEIDFPKHPKDEVEKVVISQSDSPVCEVRNEIILDYSYNHPEAYKIPNPEFFNFSGERSPERFQPGQFWALYNSVDKLPKFYGFINKIDHQPKLKLHITWFISCPTKNALNYDDKHILVGCGIFKRSNLELYSSTDTFSHRLKMEPTNKMHLFAIYPSKGEVWAVHKNWTPGMTFLDLKKCEYYIVEVIEENYFAIKGVVLEMVSGYKSVFKARKSNRSLVTIEIAWSELIRFSHQIPAFRLTSEKGGSLRGYWELDPAALPVKMFS